MDVTLEERVSILERTVSAEIRERGKMRKGIGDVRSLLENRSEAHRRMLQAIGDTQSEHTRVLRQIQETVGRMAPKVDSIEAHMHGMQLRMGHLDTRMSGLENRMDGLDVKVGELDSKVTRLDGKIDALAGQVDDKFNTIIGLLSKSMQTYRTETPAPR